MTLSFSFGHEKFSDSSLNTSLMAILEENRLLSMSTVTPAQTAHINTAYFAFDKSLQLFIITDPKTTHCVNLSNNPSIAVTVFDSHQRFWTPLKGVQMFGECHQTPINQVPHALSCFLKRFSDFSELVKGAADFVNKGVSVRLHTIAIERLKLFDEPTFGDEVFVELKLPARVKS